MTRATPTLVLLGVLAAPSTALAIDPVGALEVVDCLGARGWAQDPDQPGVSIDVHVYFNAPPGVAGAAAIAVHADGQRDDLCMQLGTCTHGYTLELPLGVRDGASHPVWAFGIDLEGVNNPVVGGPIEVTCPAPPLVDGVRRWVTAPEVIAAWQLDTFVDLAHVDDASLMGLAQDADWPLAPQLVTADGSTLWIVDGTQRRSITAEAAAAWALDPTLATVMTAAELGAMPQGPDWRPRPFLVQGTGPEVFAIDAVPCTGDACLEDDSTSDDGGSSSDGGGGDSSSDDDGGTTGEAATSDASEDGSSSAAASLGLPGAEGGDASGDAGCSCEAGVTAPHTACAAMLVLAACARRRRRC